jgi:hypothetical protein
LIVFLKLSLLPTLRYGALLWRLFLHIYPALFFHTASCLRQPADHKAREAVSAHIVSARNPWPVHPRYTWESTARTARSDIWLIGVVLCASNTHTTIGVVLIIFIEDFTHKYISLVIARHMQCI